MLWGALHARSCTLRQLSSGRGWQHGAAAGSQAPTRRQCRPRTPLRTLASTSDKIDSTLAGLDAILGIDSKKEEEEARQRVGGSRGARTRAAHTCGCVVRGACSEHEQRASRTLLHLAGLACLALSAPPPSRLAGGAAAASGGGG